MEEEKIVAPVAEEANEAPAQPTMEAVMHDLQQKKSVRLQWRL